MTSFSSSILWIIIIYCDRQYKTVYLVYGKLSAINIFGRWPKKEAKIALLKSYVVESFNNLFLLEPQLEIVVHEI